MHDDSVVRGEEEWRCRGGGGSHHYLQSKFGSAIKEGGRGGRGKRLRARKKDHHEARFEIALCHKKGVRVAR